MDRILKIGMDVHSTNYTLCAVESRFGKEDHVLANINVGPDYKLIVDFINKIKLRMDPQSKDNIDVECGYEAGCLGYSLYYQLKGCKVRCTVLAPTTMLTEKGSRIKTDHRDARNIAFCLSTGGFHSVHILFLFHVLIHFSNCHYTNLYFLNIDLYIFHNNHLRID